MWILMLERAEGTTCCGTSMMDPKFKELVVSRPFFFSWSRALRAYLFRKLNSWICCVCFFRDLLLDFGNPIDKTFHSWEDSWSVSENRIKNSAQFEQLTHCHSQCRSWLPPPGWTCHLNPGKRQWQFKWKRGSIKLSAEKQQQYKYKHSANTNTQPTHNTLTTRGPPLSPWQASFPPAPPITFWTELL